MKSTLSRLLLACAAFAVPLACADTVTVFAAASLKEALDAQARAFESASSHRIAISYAASNALAKQIEAGAPAEIFLSADVDWVDYVESRGLIAPGTRANLLRNELVLIAPAASTTTIRIAPGFALASALADRKLAMANPDAVPAGKYAKASLTALGVWTSVEPKVARAENVRAALALVARGEAPFGIVYRTDALAEKGVRIVDAFPAVTHPAIVYPMVILKAAKGQPARDFAHFLAAPGSRATWERYGFDRERW